LIPLREASALELRKREGEPERIRRDPAVMLELLLGGLKRG
jgi:hypothetical protein